MPLLQLLKVTGILGLGWLVWSALFASYGTSGTWLSSGCWRDASGLATLVIIAIPAEFDATLDHFRRLGTPARRSGYGERTFASLRCERKSPAVDLGTMLQSSRPWTPTPSACAGFEIKARLLY